MTHETNAAKTRSIRLLDTQASAHIGRRLLHRQPNGELTEDSVWRWSSNPDAYLNTALHLEFQIMQTDRTLRSHLVKASEPVSAELPGDLAVATGRLLRHLVSEGVAVVKTNE